MRIKIKIGSKEFDSKAAAERHIRDILDRHDHGQHLAGADDVFIRDLIDIHPDRALIYFDSSIAYVFVQYVDRLAWQRIPNQRRFCARRADSSYYDFGWEKAISPPNARQKLCKVLRRAIRAQLVEYRDWHFRGICEREDCRGPLRYDDCEVDHIPPHTFDNLVTDFLTVMHLTPEDIAIVGSPRYGTSSYLQNHFLTQTWQEYHQIHAHLRCVHGKCNRSRLRTSPEKPESSDAKK